MVKNTFLYIKDDTECTICLCVQNLYFNNICSCKPLVCKVCIEKLNKCPFCRYKFNNATIYAIQGIFLKYNIKDLLYPFRSFNVTPNQYYDYLYTRVNKYISGVSDLWLLTIENTNTHYIYDKQYILVEKNFDKHINIFQ